MQDLYNKHPGQLAEVLFDGRPMGGDKVNPPIERFERLYSGIFAEFPLNLPHVKTRGDKVAHTPFSEKEVVVAKGKLKQSAPGCDGLKREDIRNIPEDDLVALLNIVWGLKLIPSVWRQNRTVLIPKSDPPYGVNPGNWSPITISSLMYRMMHKIVAKRLE